MTNIAKPRYYILDLLRLMAAFSVVFYHYLPFLEGGSLSVFLAPFKYGYLGVNFFFMLSGFVIMASCQNRSALQFAFARALRIYPAFIACLLLTLVVVFLCAGNTHSFLQIISNALIINDYLGQPNIDGVYWTLQAELKFYACIFALILVGGIKYWKIWLSVWLLAAVTHHFLNQPFFLGWLISPTYSFYFIGGVCAYLLSKNSSNMHIILIFIISLVFACIKSFEQANDFIRHAEFHDGAIASFVVLVFFIFFFCLAKGYMQIAKRSYWPLMGAVSYPLYLIHNRAGKSVINCLSQYFDMHWSIAFTIVAVGLSSLFVCLYVEKVVFSLFRNEY